MHCIILFLFAQHQRFVECCLYGTTLTRQEFFVPFEEKPRRFLEFETYSNPLNCGYHCIHSLRWAYFCSPLYTIQQKMFFTISTLWTKVTHTANGEDNHCPYCYRCGQHVKNIEKYSIFAFHEPLSSFHRSFIFGGLGRGKLPNKPFLIDSTMFTTQSHSWLYIIRKLYTMHVFQIFLQIDNTQIIYDALYWGLQLTDRLT